MNVTLADFNRAATLAVQHQGLSGKDSVIHMSQDGDSVKAMGRIWRIWGSRGAAFNEANRVTRQALLDALKQEFKLDFTKKESIPKSLLTALNLGKFSLDKNGQVTSDKPLTARRIKLIATAAEGLRAEQANQRKAELRGQVKGLVDTELKARFDKAPVTGRRFRNLNPNIGNFFTSKIMKALEGRGNGDIQGERDVNHITNSITHALTEFKKLNGPAEFGDLFPALKDSDTTALFTEVKGFVETILGNLALGDAMADRVDVFGDRHTFTFEAEQKPVNAKKPAASKAKKPAVPVQPKHVQNAVADPIKVTVKMTHEQFFAAIKERRERAIEKYELGTQRFQLREADVQQFFTQLKGLANPKMTTGKKVRNHDDLLEKVMNKLIDQNSSAARGFMHDMFFPEIKTLTQRRDAQGDNLTRDEIWKDVRADMKAILEQAFEFKAE